jgi:hypothetical protein
VVALEADQEHRRTAIALEVDLGRRMALQVCLRALEEHVRRTGHRVARTDSLRLLGLQCVRERVAELLGVQ